MPYLIKHIDAISREKKRDVVFLMFEDPASDAEDGTQEEARSIFSAFNLQWEDFAVRNEIIAWLDANGFAWEPCGHFANENVMMSYQGEIYIDVPYDESLPEYRKLGAYLENEDGTTRLPGARLCLVKLEHAMWNARHDDPGFWQKWAEDF